jgi:hypothetical protein
MLFLSYYACVFPSTKLELRAEQVLPGSEAGKGGEMTQTIYAHVNK